MMAFFRTWDLVSIEFNKAPLLQFQILIMRSAVPPPLARTLGCHGHQAKALTAAWWSLQPKVFSVLLSKKIFNEFTSKKTWERSLSQLHY